MNKKQIVLTASVAIMILVIAYVSFYIGALSGTLATYRNIGEKEIKIIKHYTKDFSEKLVYETSSDGEVVISGDLTKAEMEELKKKLRELYFQNKQDQLLKYIETKE